MNPPDPALLSQLRDIHLPEPVGLWPLAPGWWIAISLLLVGSIVAVGIRRAKRRRAGRWPAATARELARIESTYEETGDAAALSIELSELLRRAAVARTGDPQIATLRGEAWLDFLCDQIESDREGSRDLLRDLTQAAYRGTKVAPPAPATWIDFSHRWISEAR